jgi:hypothetical protein
MSTAIQSRVRAHSFEVMAFSNYGCSPPRYARNMYMVSKCVRTSLPLPEGRGHCTY